MTEQIVQGIVERLKVIGDEIITLDSESDMLWGQFYALVDDIAGEDEGYRWTHPQLRMTIGRVMAENSPRLDEGKLKETLTDEQWQICTKQIRAFDLERLTTAVSNGDIAKEDVEEATTQKPPTARKHFKSASKEELKALEAAKL